MYAILLMNAATPLLSRFPQPRAFGHGRASQEHVIMQTFTPRSSTLGTRGNPPAAETEVATPALKQISAFVASGSRRRILTLGIAGLLLGLTIFGSYALILRPLIGNQNEALHAAVRKVLPGATRFQPLRYTNGHWQSAAPQTDDSEVVYAGYNQAGTVVGYAVPAAGPGYQDTIRLLYGYQPAKRRIVGMQVLDSQETPGSGDKISQDPDFQNNFHDLAVDPVIITVKEGAKVKSNEVDTITGATVTSNSVVAIINAANRRWLNRLPAPGSEPPLAEDGG